MGVITTVAGNGTTGYSGDSGPAISAQLNQSYGVAVDSAGNIYIADYANNRIRRVDTSGNITTVAGNGTFGYSGDGGPATSASLKFPTSVAIDSTGNIYIADYGNQRIRKVQGATGTVWTWGRNLYGQLGDGTTTNRNTPVQVSGLIGVTAIAGGDSHTIALKSDGTVWTWGDNGYGQLGNASTTNSTAPVQVSQLSGLTSVTAIAGGDTQTIALKTDGTVWTWGDNGQGQLGNASTTSSTIPVQVSQLSGLTSVIAIASQPSGHTIALKIDGTVWTWGNNVYGQLGDGTTTNRNTPVQVGGLTGVTAIAGGELHTIAIGPFTTCTSTNATVSSCQVTSIPAGQSGSFTPQQAVSIGLTGVTGSANICITFSNPPSNPVINKVVNGIWGNIYPGTPQWNGISNVTYGNGQICFTILDNSDADGNPTVGAITDPVVIGFAAAPFTITGTASAGGNSSLSLVANFTLAVADIGRTGSFYIAAQLATGELFFLTPSGFMLYMGGPLPTFSTGTLSNQSITVLSGANVTPYPGAILFAGYGLDEADLIDNGKYSAIYTVQ